MIAYGATARRIVEVAEIVPNLFRVGIKARACLVVLNNIILLKACCLFNEPSPQQVGLGQFSTIARFLRFSLESIVQSLDGGLNLVSMG